MKELSPLATRLLRRFAPGLESEAITGDIAEFAQLGRSRAWVWRQVIAVIIGSSWRGTREQPLGSLTAMAAGWCVVLALFGVSSRVAPERLGLWTLWFNVGPVAVVPWTPWWNSMLDWRVATLWCVGFVASGWIVVRFRPSAMLAFATSVFGWSLTSTVVLMCAPFWFGLRWYAPNAEATPFVIYATAYLLLTTVFSPLLVILGGVAGRSTSPRRQSLA